MSEPVTEESLRARAIKICNDFMVDKYVESVKASKCPCLDEPGYLIFSPNDNNQMVYISSDTIFRGMLESPESKLQAVPFSNRDDIVEFIRWFYVARKNSGIMESLKENCSFDDSCIEDLSDEDIDEFLFNTFIGPSSMNGLYCQKQGLTGCCFYTTGCDVQGV
ncbi:hypothetical protein GMST_18680 [Geomonas silvestris]|uniref:Uncharacterized protein n=1 Tax=Geomonas silvestris TaxID=2740184 RepID=A0A6V8MIC2_9BACT|nr:hypothetical protein [Geomonas silvestris]GFO59543.1 hypothetical protein GMST_18680 [Geomonas silvestris]